LNGASERVVSIIQTAAAYPEEAPFHPDSHYPEFGSQGPLSERNNVFGSVRALLVSMGLDESRFGRADWNPLGTLIRAGDTVVLKPNLIAAFRKSKTRCGEWQQVITNGSVVRAIADYVAVALGSSGRILIVDGPETEADFLEIVRLTGLDRVREHLCGLGVRCELLDLRRERWIAENEVLAQRLPLPGDPSGYVEVALDDLSEFYDYGLSGRFYGADYDDQETASYHCNGRHRYVMCRSVMDADVIIDIPKLKTHKKTGITLSMKNMVGVNGLRNSLPHFTMGSASEGGDEFPPGVRGARIQSHAIRAFKRALVRQGGKGGCIARNVKRAGRLALGPTEEVIRSGNWFGNDTAWRMVLDLNKAVTWFDADGLPRSTPRRRLSIVDGIVAGEGNGPLDPDPKPCGVLVGGANAVAVDTTCTLLMGFDDASLPLLRHAWRAHGYPLASFGEAEVECRSTRPSWCGGLASLRKAPHLGFRPHFGWRGHIEREVE
jgi:uncharacterized protein (DUF362 family)